MVNSNNDKYIERRELAFSIIGNNCVVCGSNDRLEIDHIDPNNKEFAIGKIWAGPIDRYIKELEKCQPLCHDCHINKSKIDNGVEHGGGASGKRNCPCPACKYRKSEYMKKYKLSRL